MVIQAIGKMCSHVGRGVLAILTDADLLFRTGGLSSLLLLGFFSTHAVSRVVGRTVERWLGIPKIGGSVGLLAQSQGCSIFF